MFSSIPLSNFGLWGRSEYIKYAIFVSLLFIIIYFLFFDIFKLVKSLFLSQSIATLDSSYIDFYLNFKNMLLYFL